MRRAIDVVGRELVKKRRQSLFQVVVGCMSGHKWSSFAPLAICLPKPVVRDRHQRRTCEAASELCLPYKSFHGKG